MTQEFAKLSISSPDSRETHIRKDSVLSVEISGSERIGFVISVTYGLPGGTPQTAKYFSNSREPFDSFRGQLTGSGDMAAAPARQETPRDSLRITRGAGSLRSLIAELNGLPAPREEGWTVRKMYGKDAYHCYYHHPMFGMSFGVEVSFDVENGTASVLDVFRTDTEMKITDTQYNRCLELFVKDFVKPVATEGNLGYEYSADAPATPGEN